MNNLGTLPIYILKGQLPKQMVRRSKGKKRSDKKEGNVSSPHRGLSREKIHKRTKELG